MKRIVFIIVSFIIFLVPLSVHGQNADNSNVIMRADLAFKNGEYDTAENLYYIAAYYAKNDANVNALKQKAKNAARAYALQKKAGEAWSRGDKVNALQRYEDLLKLNPNDPLALDRVKEGEQIRQLEKAMYWYGRKDYDQALVHFSKAGSSARWSSRELAAYERCEVEYDYRWWRNASSDVAVARAERFLSNHPNSIYDTEIRDFLIDAYIKSTQLDRAYRFAVTAAQKSRIARARQAVYKAQRSQAGGFLTESSSTPKQWSPTLGLGLELSPAGSPKEGAIPIELRLLNPNNALDISLGARIGIRGMTSPDTLLYSDGNPYYSFHIKASYSYFQLSPFVRVKLHVGEDIPSGAFFLGLVGRLNYNFNYTLYKTDSELNQYGTQYSKSNKYHTKDMLTTITPTVAGELGYGNKKFEFYIFCSYDRIDPFDYSKLIQMRNDLENPHGQMFSQTTFMNRYMKDFFWGAGFRCYLGD